MRSQSDPNMYIKFDAKKHVMMIYLYVGDLISTINSVKLIDGIKEKMPQ